MTNWSNPQRSRLVRVRRRIGTPPTGSRHFGVSSEWGRSRVAQPAARMTAFIFDPASCNPCATPHFAGLGQKGVQVSPPRPPGRLRTVEVLSLGANALLIEEASAVDLDAIVVADGPLARVRIAGLSAQERAIRVARKVGATRVHVLAAPADRAALAGWRGEAVRVE